MATTSVNFVLQDYEATLYGAAFTPLPFLSIFERQSAMLLTGRNPGGSAYRQPPWVTPAKSIIALDDIATVMDADGLAKHGAFHVTTSGTTAVNIDLTNLVTNATSQAGDATFATINKIVAFNVSGLDGVSAANMTLAQGASNPAPLGFGGTSPTVTVYASSPWVWFNKAGGTITSSAKIITITPTAGGNFVLLVAGS